MRTIKVILFFLILITSVLARSQKNNLDWAKHFLNNPQQYFSSSYEIAIFQKFKTKFSDLRLKNARRLDQTYILEVKIPPLKDTYHLVLDIDEKKQVSSVHRNPLQANEKYTGDTDKVVLKWLGKLFYRLDAGDSAALYDMIFYDDIKIRYKDLSSKREIISTLIDHYRTTIQPNEITIHKESNIYEVLVSIRFSDDILLQIPYAWANAADTDKMQNYLYQKIISQLNKNGVVQSSIKVQNKSQLNDYLSHYYPDYKIDGDIIHISYPKLSSKVLNEMRYKIATHIFDSGFDPTKIKSIIKLNYNKDDGTVILNNACKFSFYNSPKSDEALIDRSEDALQKLYNMLLLFPDLNDEHYRDKLKGNVHYRGYTNYNLVLSTSQKWANFWQTIRKEGSVYFYPSHIEFLTDELVIEGLIYIIRDKNLNLYHFAEVKAHFPEYEEVLSMELDLTFYPFVNRSSFIDSQTGAK